MTKARFAFAGALASSAALGACTVFFDFNQYDTTVPADDGASPVPTAPAPTPTPAGSFDLVTPDAMTITPGTTAHLTITIARHDDGNGPVSITVPETPPGLVPVPATAVAPDASSAVLDLQVLATATPATVPLRITAAEGALSETTATALTLRGPPCSPDLGFGPDASGVIHVRAGAPGDFDRGVFLAVDGAGFVFAALANTSDVIDGFDENADFAWTAPSYGLLTMTLDGDGGSYVAAEHDMHHLFPNGEADPAFGGGEGPYIGAILPVGMAMNGSVLMALNSGDGPAWALQAWAPDGGILEDAEAPFVPDPAATLLAYSLAASGTAFFACGVRAAVGTSEAVYSRWELDGGVSPTFGTNGVLTLDDGTDALDCVADDAGIVTVGVQANERALFSLRPDGTIDSAFGDGGFAPAIANLSVAPKHIIFGGNTVLVLSDDGTTASVSRYDRRTGALDPTFGTNGVCSLDAFGLQSASVIAFTNDGKLLVLGSELGGSIVGRLWL